MTVACLGLTTPSERSKLIQFRLRSSESFNPRPTSSSCNFRGRSLATSPNAWSCAQAKSRAPAATNQPGGQIAQNRSRPPRKNILIFRNRKSVYVKTVPPDERGGSRSSRTCGGMRWTRWRRMTSAVVADGEAVWSRHPDAGVKFAGSKTFRG